MKISPHWLRDYVDIPVDYLRLADELTLAGVAVEGISGEGDNTVYEMEITTNRPDAMNHYWRGSRGLGALRSAAQSDRAEAAAFAGKSDVTIDIQSPACVHASRRAKFARSQSSRRPRTLLVVCN